MADKKEQDGPTIGERVGSTIVQGVKQGVIGLAAGGAAGAALGALAGYVAGDTVEAAKDMALKSLDGSIGQSALNEVNSTLTSNVTDVTAAQVTITAGAGMPTVVEGTATIAPTGQTVAAAATQGLNNLAASFAQHQEALGAPTAKVLTESANYTADMIKDGNVSVEEAKNFITEGYNSVVKPAVDALSGDLTKLGAVVGGTAGGAGMAAKGAMEGLIDGSPTKHAERLAAKGTKRGIESIIQDAIERGQQEQVGFVQAVEKERSNKSVGGPPTLAV